MTRKSRGGSKGATIRQVARHAGVSPMTVSRVFNGDKNVREDTRLRVTASIKALQYSPNMAARSLAAADAVRIGVIYSNPSASYLNEFLFGALEQSGLDSCQLVIERCLSPGGERSVIEKLSRTGADGVILPPPLCDCAEALQAAEDVDLPAVMVATGRPANWSVRIDDFEAARAMTRHLVSLGHTRIGFIRGNPNQSVSGERYRGFVAAMAEAGLAVAPEQVAQGYFSYRSGIVAAESLLEDRRRITAIFASNDDMASGAVAVAHRMGLDVPSDLTVAGFDDTPAATTVWPPLTTVRQPIADMGRMAVTLLLERIRIRRGGADGGQCNQKILAHALVERESSGVRQEPARAAKRERT